MAGGDVAGDSDAGGGSLGVAEVSGLSEPGYNGGGAGREVGGGSLGGR